jgi:hypothetical protein
MLINYRNISESSLEEIEVWDDWRYELSIIDIMKFLEYFYDIFIKDVYSIHFLSNKRVLNVTVCIEYIDELKTYLGNDGECLYMVSIYENVDNVVNLRKISNILDKKVIIRDIKLSRLI